MAKELPYFKFEPNEWENGNIQICSRDDKGLFMDLCSMYWSRLGDVPFKLAVQKLCNGNATAFDTLINENIFTVEDGDICIDFLNEQLMDFDNLSKINSKNARDGWKKRREKCEKDATALKSQSEIDGIREDNRKVNKKKEDNNRFYEILLNSETWLETIAMKHKCKIGFIKTKLEEFNKELFLRADQKQNQNEYQSHFVSWLNKNHKQETAPKQVF